MDISLNWHADTLPSVRVMAVRNVACATLRDNTVELHIYGRADDMARMGMQIAEGALNAAYSIAAESPDHIAALSELSHNIEQAKDRLARLQFDMAQSMRKD